MRRLLFTLLGLSVTAALVALPLLVEPPAAGMAAPSASSAAPHPSAGPHASASALPDAGVDPGPTADTADGSVFDRLPDGGDIPMLPLDAGDRARLGVILFRYQGAQGAASSARSKSDALRLAREALETAKKDFEAGVGKGDPGSVSDAGRIPRGVLERSLEYRLFTLEPGELYGEPLDTPRGYWILKRLE